MRLVRPVSWSGKAGELQRSWRPGTGVREVSLTVREVLPTPTG